MVGRAASAGFAPCGTGGLGLTGPEGELEEDAALRRVASSGLVSPRVEVFSGAAESALIMEPLGDLLSVVVEWGLADDTCKHTYQQMKLVQIKNRTVFSMNLSGLVSGLPVELLSGLSGLED